VEDAVQPTTKSLTVSQKIKSAYRAAKAARYLKVVQIDVGRSLTAMTELREYCNIDTRWSMYSGTCNKIWQTSKRASSKH